MLILSNPDCQVPKRGKQKEFQDKIAHVVEELKGNKYSRLFFFFALNGVLEKWVMCSESP